MFNASLYLTNKNGRKVWLIYRINHTSYVMNKICANKKVLFVTSSLSGGGAERVLTTVANYLKKNGAAVAVLKTSTKIKGNYDLDSRIPVIELPKISANKVTKAFFMVHNIRKVFLQHKDYVIISFLSDNNMLSILASRGLGNKLIISERNDPSQNCGNEYLRWIRNQLYRLADWNVFQTEDAKNYFCQYIQRRSSVIPNPIYIKDGQNSYKLHVEKTIIAVGRLTPQKNYPMLISAFDIFHRSHPEYKLRIFGDGPLKDEIIALIEKYSLSEYVQLRGFTNTIYDEMKKSKIYVSSSDYEGISNTMLEALALGIPTIVTDCPVGGGKLVIEDGVNGFLVPVGDSERLAMKLCQLVEDETLMSKFSYNSQSVKVKFSVERICSMWEDII